MTPVNRNGYFSTTLILHMPYVLKWSGTLINEHGSFLVALLHMSYVLKWSGTSVNEHGSLSTALLHMSFVLNDLRSCFIYRFS